MGACESIAITGTRIGATQMRTPNTAEPLPKRQARAIPARHPRRGGNGVLRRWHRRLGVAAAVVVSIMVLTGLALNHAGEWGLSTLRLRGLAADPFLSLLDERAALLDRPNGPQLPWIDGWLVIPDRERIHALDDPVGALAVSDGFLVAARETILLFTPDGRLVERMGAALLPGTIVALGKDRADRPVLRTTSGLFRFDPDLGAATPFAGSTAAVAWAGAPRPPANAQERRMLRHAARLVGVPLIDVLAAVHSGRIFGLPGRLVSDIVALALLYLAASGLVLAHRRKRRRRLEDARRSAQADEPQ